VSTAETPLPPQDDLVILKKPSFQFWWYHRDELQIVGVIVVLMLFFSCSELYPHDATAYATAGVLGLPVVMLTLRGAWHAARWHIR
jgi:hypothetical protein